MKFEFALLLCCMWTPLDSIWTLFSFLVTSWLSHEGSILYYRVTHPLENWQTGRKAAFAHWKSIFKAPKSWRTGRYTGCIHWYTIGIYIIQVKTFLLQSKKNRKYKVFMNCIPRGSKINRIHDVYVKYTLSCISWKIKEKRSQKPKDFYRSSKLGPKFILWAF